MYNNNGVVEYRGGTKIYSYVIVTQYIMILLIFIYCVQFVGGTVIVFIYY